MSDENKKSHTAQAAGAVNSAAKIGKAIANSSKGAALGPYGLAATIAWENRHTIGKICAVVLAFLLLPVIMLTVLPGTVTGSMSGGTSYSQISSTIDNVMADAQSYVNEQIIADFATYGADFTMTVTTSSTPTHDPTRIISEYLALTDLEQINTADLTSRLSAQMDRLFYFTKTEISPNIVNYQITYIGDDYITNEIFRLTDEQKQLAADLAETLNLYMGDETNAETD